MATALDIITRSLRLLGVLATTETPDGATGADALATLNTILDTWSLEKLNNWAMLNSTYAITANVGTYTIGASGAALTSQRPIQIESAFIRDSSNSDFSLEIIPNDLYQQISSKSDTATIPTHLSYNPTYPNGTINLYPIPSLNVTLGLSQVLQLARFTLISSSVTFPLGYENALGYALAVELGPEYGKYNPEIVRLAQEKKAILKNANYQPSYLACDSALIGDGSYDIYNDRY
jgi:hypothetical protein